MNALVANAKTASGLAVIRSLGKKGIEVTGASDFSTDFPLFSKYCKKRIVFRTDSNNISDRIDELLELVKNIHYDVLLPVLTEAYLLELAKRKDEFEKYTRIAIPDHDQLSRLNNKASVSSFLAEAGLPRPKTYFAENDADLKRIVQEAVFPLVIKPHRGEGAVGITIVNDSESLLSAFPEIRKKFGPSMIQEFIPGTKHTAVYLLNKNSEVRRFFVHRAIREYPVTGGPTCFLESISYEPVFEVGLKLLQMAKFTGLASMEFVVDERDGKPKIIDVNPRFYGPLQCAISSGADLPYAVYNMALKGDIETDLSYKTGVKCRHLLFEDTKHMISVLKGAKSPKYKFGKIKTLINYLNFFNDDSYFVLSLSDPKPALKKIFGKI